MPQIVLDHAGDREKDSILRQSDSLEISESWMAWANTVQLNGFELKASNKITLEYCIDSPYTSYEPSLEQVSSAGVSEF